MTRRPHLALALAALALPAAAADSGWGARPDGHMDVSILYHGQRRGLEAETLMPTRSGDMALGAAVTWAPRGETVEGRVHLAALLENGPLVLSGGIEAAGSSYLGAALGLRVAGQYFVTSHFHVGAVGEALSGTKHDQVRAFAQVGLRF